MMYFYDFEIADVRLSFITKYQVEIPEELKPFTAEKTGKPDIWCELTVFSDQAAGLPLGHKYREIAYGGYGDYIDFYELPDGRNYCICFPDCLIEKGILFYRKKITGYLGLERMLIDHNCFWLHASLIRWKGKTFLFCGPSGIGKSTQAALWQRYEDAEILNGDRSLIRLSEETGPYAYGSPFAGSSGIYKNAGSKLSAIFILQQSSRNYLEEMSSARTFLLLYAQTLQCTQSTYYRERLQELLMQLIRCVPVIKLSCDISSDAVKIVRDYLEGLL